MSVPNFGQIRRRLEQLGSNLETSRYAISLDSQDAETGQYGIDYTHSTIDAIIQPNSAAIQNIHIGYYPVHIATIYTDTAIVEGDVIKDARDDWYLVKTVSPIEFGDGTILYEGELAYRFIDLCPTGDQITNGGFETGDLTGWTSNNADTSSGHHHSGSYSAYILWDDCLGTSGYLTQSFSPVIPVYCITELSLYAKNTCGTNPSYAVNILATYSDATTDNIQKTGTNSSTWTKLNFTAGLTSTKLLSSIKISVTDCTHYVDDITLNA